jgi:hypothetical protein
MQMATTQEVRCKCGKQGKLYGKRECGGFLIREGEKQWLIRSPSEFFAACPRCRWSELITV